MNPSEKKGFSIAALVLGIVAAATGIFYIISLPTGILGIIFASISLNKRYGNRGMALAGLITAIIGTAFGALILTIAIVAGVNGVRSGSPSYY